MVTSVARVQGGAVRTVNSRVVVNTVEILRVVKRGNRVLESTFEKKETETEDAIVTTEMEADDDDDDEDDEEEK